MQVISYILMILQENISLSKLPLWLLPKQERITQVYLFIYLLQQEEKEILLNFFFSTNCKRFEVTGVQNKHN